MGITNFVADTIVNNLLASLAEILVQWANKLLEFSTTILGINLNLLNDLLTKTPQNWNPTVYNAVFGISDTVIKPIAAVIITFVMCYEIYNIAIVQNSIAQDGQELYALMRIIFKMGICVLVLNNYQAISNAFFDLGAEVVSNALGSLNTTTTAPTISFDFSNYADSGIETIDLIGAVIGILPLTLLVLIAVIVLAAISVTVLGGRFIEIYLYLSVAPLAFATFGNQETAQIGKNYVKNLLALAFQGFFVTVVVAIYISMLSALPSYSQTDVGQFLVYLIEFLSTSVILGVAMFKSRSISKSIFDAH